jgi:hypothetical protein
MDATINFWHPQKLTEAELNEIATRLFNWQKAWVMAVSVSEEQVEIDEQTRKNKKDIESLIRHIAATQKEK